MGPIMEIKRITPEQAKELLDSNQGYIYLDVRTVPEFEAGHVPGAKNVPVVEPDASGRMQLNPRFVEIVEANFGKDVKCITGCQKGGRSILPPERVKQLSATLFERLSQVERNRERAYASLEF